MLYLLVPIDLCVIAVSVLYHLLFSLVLCREERELRLLIFSFERGACVRVYT